MTSPRQKKAGWPIPENPSTALKCVTLKIPDDLLFEAAFIGAVFELSKWWNWDKSYEPGDTRATEAAALWRALLIEHMRFGTCEELGIGATCEGCKMRIGDITFSINTEFDDTLLPADGRTISGIEHAELWGVIAEQFKSGSDPEQPPTEDSIITLPNLVERFPRGANYLTAGQAVAGITGGESTVTLSQSQMPAHSHTGTTSAARAELMRVMHSAGTNTSSANHAVGRGSGTFDDKTNNVWPGSQHNHSFTTSSAGGGKAHENKPPFVNLYPYIKVKPCEHSAGGQPTMIRQKPDDTCVLQVSYNGGLSWADAFDYDLCRPPDYSTSATLLEQWTQVINAWDAVLEGYDGTPQSVWADAVYGDTNDGVRDDALCFGLDAYIRNLRQAAIEIDARRRQGVINQLGIIAALMGLVAGAAGLGFALPIFAILGGKWFLLSMGMGAFGVIIAQTTLEFPAGWQEDDDLVNDLVCCMYTSLAGQTLSYGAFIAAVQACETFQEDNPLMQLLSIASDSSDSYVGLVDFIGEVYDATLADPDIVFPCPCTQDNEPECEGFNITWSSVGATPPGWTGEKDNGAGEIIGEWTRANNTNWTHPTWMGGTIELDFGGECVISNLQITVDYGTTNQQSLLIYGWINGVKTTLNSAFWPAKITNPTTRTLAWNGNQTVSKIAFRAWGNGITIKNTRMNQ